MAGNNSIQFLRGTATQISSSTQTALAGQPVYDLTNGYLYVGNGSTQIKDLKPVSSNIYVGYGKKETTVTATAVMTQPIYNETTDYLYTEYVEDSIEFVAATNGVSANFTFTAREDVDGKLAIRIVGLVNGKITVTYKYKVFTDSNDILNINNQYNITAQVSSITNKLSWTITNI